MLINKVAASLAAASLLMIGAGGVADAQKVTAPAPAQTQAQTQDCITTHTPIYKNGVLVSIRVTVTCIE